MPISAAGCKDTQQGFTPLRRFAEHGFTLVELMVVLVIIGLMSAVVTFALPDSRATLRQEAVRLAARSAAARDMAIVSSRPVRLRLDATGYAFDRRSAGTWVAIADKPYTSQPWSGGIVVASPALVAFDPAGGTSPETLVTMTRDTARISVRFGADGAIDVEG